MLINEKLKIGLQEIFFSKARKCFAKILISRIILKIKLRIMIKKYAVVSAIKLLKKSILWPIVFTETTRHCWS